MPVIRELITMFGFEVDEKGAKNVEKRVDGMKQGIGSLGKLMGVTLGAAGAKAFFNIGQRAERAEFNLQRMAGTDFKLLRRQFSLIQEDLNNVREGAAQIVTQKQFDIAATGFLKVFGKGEGQLKAFNKLFTFAAKQAAITGGSVVDIFEQIQSGVQGGGFEGLLDIPGFDIFRKQLLEFQQQAIDPGEPGGRIALQNRLRAVIGVVTEATDEQNTVLKQVPDSLLEMDKAGAKTKDTFEQLGKTINSLLVPAMKGLNIVLNRFNELIEVGREAKTPGGAIENIFKELFDPQERPLPAIPIEGTAPLEFPGFRGDIPDPDLNVPPSATRVGLQDVFPPRGVGQGGTGREATTETPNGGDTYYITNKFDISGAPDAKAVAKEAISVFQNSISSAKRSIIKTEE